MTEKTAAAPPVAGAGERAVGPDAIAEFERLYRANVDAVMGYFARRSRDPHVVADLTADTFLAGLDPAPEGRPMKPDLGQDSGIVDGVAW